MIIRQMLKEEWRMHSTLFRGRHFALFPFMIFGFVFSGTYAVVNYSSLGIGALSTFIKVLGGFLGLGVGVMGFSSKDAMKNVLGPTNFLVYASRTLPVSETRLLFSFIVKDLIYYTFLFLIPISLGFIIPTGFASIGVGVEAFLWFLGGLVLSFAVARSSLGVPFPMLSYRRSGYPVVSKSILDVWRSTGGVMKVLFSLTVLTGFYWTMVFYFPFTQPLMNNPLLSFSILLGVSSLTIYNWLNRFDSLGDYTYLPLGRSQLLESKQQAYILLSGALTLPFFAVSAYFYFGNVVLALGSLAAVQVYTAGIASYLTGLEPNSRLFDTFVFLRYLGLNSIFVMPLLVLSVFYKPVLLLMYVVLLMLTGSTGFVLMYITARRKMSGTV